MLPDAAAQTACHGFRTPHDVREGRGSPPRPSRAPLGPELPWGRAPYGRTTTLSMIVKTPPPSGASSQH